MPPGGGGGSMEGVIVDVQLWKSRDVDRNHLTRIERLIFLQKAGFIKLRDFKKIGS
jgi:hypothetical protein